jgi:branched-chain amino acid transport system ATP-binding protein
MTNSSNQKYVVELQDVHLSVKGKTVLNIDHIAIAERSGVSAVLLGANGAGKTSTLNCLTGYSRASSGIMSLMTDRYYSLSNMSPHAIVQAGLTRSFQTPQWYPSLKVRDVLMLASINGRTARGHTWSKANAHEAIATTVQRFGLQSVIDSKYNTFDLGTARRIELARCLLSRPCCILLDEPTAGLSSTDRKWWFAAITDLLSHFVAGATGTVDSNSSNVTIGLVTHDWDLLYELKEQRCQPEAYLLSEGRVTFTGDLAAVLEEYYATIQRVG